MLHVVLTSLLTTIITSMQSPPPSHNKKKSCIHNNGACTLHSDDNGTSNPAEDLRLFLENPARLATLDLDVFLERMK